jgi:plasmid stabilization system protein ParE
LEAIRAYIGFDKPIAAQRMFERLKLAADGLYQFPERGRLDKRGVRELPVVYPYLIRYRVREGRVEIVRIKHGAQRPG